MSDNKVRFGLRNVHYAVYTPGVNGALGTYATPVAVPGAVQLDLSREGNESSFYADDSKYYTMDANAGYSGTLEMALVPDQMLEDLLGYIEDAGGAVVEDVDGKQAEFALSFEVQGDANPTRYTYYNCKLSRPENSFETIGESADPQTQSLNVTMVSRDFPWGTGETKKIVKTHHTKVDDSDTLYTGWFTSVHIPTKPSA